MTKAEFKNIRIENGLTQAEFAKLLQVSERSLQRRESEYDKTKITLRDRWTIQLLKETNKLK